MRVIKRNTVVAITLAAVAVFGLAACSSPATTASTPKATHSSAPAKANPAADLVGSGCAAYAKQVPTGGGSIVGMSQDPVAVAASNNPLLTTLVSAVSGKLNPSVNLVSTLDGSQFTVFAPVDSAFAKLPAATVTALMQPANATLLTSILTYHVVPGEILPSSIDGTHTTVEGQDLTVTGSGNNIQFNGANVICGGVHTANATVYLIDTVLSVPAK
jgi:uncharacterized surface protein with fasciclin (FAS1) repeats